LLRVLDERKVSPLGTEESHEVSFQLISASHGHLQELAQQGRFREDLYYRLAGIELDIPALRDRTDLGDLLRQILLEESGGECVLSAEAERILMAYAWPGNIRQLRHVMRSASALSDGHLIGREHLQSIAAFIERPSALVNDEADDDLENAPLAGLNPVQLGERAALLTLLIESRWNVSLVAKSLHTSRTTLYRKLHKLQIPVTLPSRSC
jgi:transcriptional regulator of acetoin/glycerol metabolism